MHLRSMWDFLRFWVENFRLGWDFGDHVFAGAEVLFALVAGFLLLRKKTYGHQKRWEEIATKLAAILLLLSFVISTVSVAPFLQYDHARVKPDLRVSVMSYGYDSKTHELFSDVQYVNNGKRRRIILGANLFYRARGENGNHPLIDAASPRSILFGYGSPLYVEPNKPIVQTYKYKLDDELVNLTTTPGEVFGIQFTADTPTTGTTLFSTVEAMVVVEGWNHAIGLLSGSKHDISLDTQGGYSKMEEPTVMLQPSPTPDEGETPHK